MTVEDKSLRELYWAARAHCAESWLKVAWHAAQIKNHLRFSEQDPITQLDELMPVDIGGATLTMNQQTFRAETIEANLDERGKQMAALEALQ